MSWITRLQDSIADKGDKIPAGWFCAKDESKRIGITPQNTRKNVRAAVKAGILEARTFRVAINGKLRLVQHYKETK